jgi:hypothetical protein
MKKKLNVDSIQSELRGGSAFFPGYKGADSPTEQAEKQKPAAPTPTASPVRTAAQPKPANKTSFPAPEKPVTPHIQRVEKQKSRISEDASTLARKQDSLQASKLASTLALTPDLIESVRKTVKNPGKEEVLYVRISKEEKDSLSDVSYTYKRQGIKTSDNELVRIALNALLEEYKINGEKSVLALILESLHA